MANKSKIDGRSRPITEQGQVRHQVIKAWNDGVHKRTIAERLGLSYSGVNKIIRRLNH